MVAPAGISSFSVTWADSTVQYSTVQYSTERHLGRQGEAAALLQRYRERLHLGQGVSIQVIQYSTVHYSTVQY